MQSIGIFLPIIILASKQKKKKGKWSIVVYSFSMSERLGWMKLFKVPLVPQQFVNINTYLYICNLFSSPKHKFSSITGNTINIICSPALSHVYPYLQSIYSMVYEGSTAVFRNISGFMERSKRTVLLFLKNLTFCPYYQLSATN